jgi:hypothetical protein
LECYKTQPDYGDKARKTSSENESYNEKLHWGGGKKRERVIHRTHNTDKLSEIN